MATNRKKAYLVYQYNQWFTTDSKVLFGVFVDKTFEEVKEIAMNGFEAFYKGFKEDVYSNGRHQWLTDKYDFGFSIDEVETNCFGEV